MRIISLTLNNIRSYPDASFTFPEGIVLLSGDIGAGKSTVLLAIEFALFGLLRSELSGNALLRNGALRGSATLTFDANGKQYTIHRALKRNKTSVEQESGHILIDGAKTEGTAVELKSKILEILGYPSELLTKAKNDIWRYTVYTPQEDMKKILTETPEERLKLLRRVFDIDKYQRIAENAQTYTKALRERKRAIELATLDLDEKKKQHQTLLAELNAAREKQEHLKPQIDTARAQLLTLAQELKALELKRQEYERAQREHVIAQATITAKKNQHDLLEKELSELAVQLANAPPPLPDASAIAQEKTKLHTEKTQHETQLRASLMKTAEHNILKQQSAALTQKINSLAKCPTCLQNVNAEHKHHILQTEQEKTSTLENESQTHSTNAKNAEEKIRAIQAQIDLLGHKEREIAVARVKHEQHTRNNARHAALRTQQEQLTQELILLTKKMTDLSTALAAMSPPSELARTREQHDALTQTERQLSIEHSAASQKIETITKTTLMLQNDITRKETAKKQLEQSQKAHNYLADAFIPLMSHIEKHVMAKIHHEFDALFTEWFSQLANELLSARLDSTFTPAITQNGYDTDVEHMSGGERTACALAYRLALNKTINSLINTIQTKDLLILDEPTDGFSSEQLDKMRDVLAQTQLKQIIIVSHEQKIEGFADHIIRIHKNEHASTLS